MERSARSKVFSVSERSKRKEGRKSHLIRTEHDCVSEEVIIRKREREREMGKGQWKDGSFRLGWDRFFS